VPSRTLQHTATQVPSRTMQHNATHCNTLQHIATISMVMMTVSALTCTATHCTTLQHIAAHCNRIHCYEDCECPHAAREHILSRKHTHTHLCTQLLFLSRTHAPTRCARTHTLFHTHTLASTNTYAREERINTIVRTSNATHSNALQHTATH